SPGPGGAEEGEKETRGRQGLPPRPGDEADRRQGQPHAGGRTARGTARRDSNLTQPAPQPSGFRPAALGMRAVEKPARARLAWSVSPRVDTAYLAVSGV